MFCHHTASESGGAISSQKFVRIVVSATTFSSNTAIDGAALSLKDNASAVLDGGVQLLGNVAAKSGGGVAAEGNTQVRMQHTRPHAEQLPEKSATFYDSV